MRHHILIISPYSKRRDQSPTMNHHGSKAFPTEWKRIPLILVLILLLTLSATTHSVEIDRRELLNCGELLGRVASVCGSHQHSNRVLCCDALEEWNDEFCWCDENAFAALSNVAKDSYAFTLRDKSCNATMWFRPPVSQPSPKNPTVPNTCPDLESVSENDDSEGCKIISPKFLREGRKAALGILLNSTMKSNEKEDVEKWSRVMDRIFVAGASWVFVGFGFYHPRMQIKEFLLSRLVDLGGSFWKYPKMFKLHWRATNVASFQASKYIGPYAYSRVDFVTFEKCSPKIKELYTQTGDYARLTQQYVYIEESDRFLKPLTKTPLRWCRVVQTNCKDDDFPFASLEECKTFYHELRNKGQVLCMRDGSFVPHIALHGNTTSCRASYLSLAQLDPKKYCPQVGKTGGARCSQDQCPLNAYEDAFRKPNPRFPGVGGTRCYGSHCYEIWPAEK